MKLLLDTHIFIWAIAQCRRLSTTAASLIRAPDNRFLASVISAYEIEFRRSRDSWLTGLPAIAA